MSPQDSPSQTQSHPFTVEYYYKARWFAQIGQYHGAGVFTGFWLLLRHTAQR